MWLDQRLPRCESLFGVSQMSRKKHLRIDLWGFGSEGGGASDATFG